MTDVVVVGATGFIGRYFLDSVLCEKEIRLRVLVHKTDPGNLSNKNNITVIEGDLLCPETLDRLCVKNAVVINLAYLRNQKQEENLVAINNLLDICVKAGVSRFIHCSTASVFGRVSSDIITENSKCNPLNEYEITKMRIEEAILKRTDNAFEAVILRPTATFGPEGKNLLKLADDLRSGNKIANYLKASLYKMRKMNLVSVHNVAAAIKFFIHTDKKINREIFIVSDDESKFNNYYYIERYLIKNLGFTGYPIPVIPAPYLALKMILMLTNKPNFNPLCVYDCQKLLNLGFRKTVSFEDELANFTNWYRRHFIEQKSFVIPKYEKMPNRSIACVTGASGNIGSKITAILLSQGYRVRILSRKAYAAVSGVEVFKGDINDEALLKNFMQDSQLLFHCAAELKDRSKMWTVNVKGTERILKYAALCGTKYLCYMSSVGVIGNTDLKLADESSPCNPRNVYEKSKWAAEQLVARGIRGCKVVILRPTNVIDEIKPGILLLPKRRSFIDFCKVFIKGEEYAHIVHAEDVAHAALYFISYPIENPQCYIVSCDNDPLNTPAGLWALYNAYRKGITVDNVRAIPHLPLFVPYILRRIFRGTGSMKNVRYSSKKLIETGFVFKLGLRGAVSRIALASGSRTI